MCDRTANHDRGDVVGRLAEVADAWAGLDPERLEVGEVGRLLRALDRQVNRLQAAGLTLTASFDRRGGTGFHSLGAAAGTEVTRV